MTPIQIEILAHYYKTNKHIDLDNTNHKARAELLNFGLLRDDLKNMTGIGLTELGKSHLFQMCSLSLPGKIYKYPDFKIQYLDKKDNNNEL